MQILDSVEVRVLGSLIEKEATTPEYYPLSLNALVAACNQKSSREPVVAYDEDTVRHVIEALRAKQLLYIIEGGRVSKYRQRISETLNLGRRELAVLCVLMLRGAQTLGEITDRSERLFSFADLGEAEGVLDRLAEWPGGALAVKLPRQAGQKDARYAHLLEGQPPAVVETVAPPSRLSQLEEEVQQLRTDVAALKSRVEELESLLR
jgi:uncharacterized protein